MKNSCLDYLILGISIILLASGCSSTSKMSGSKDKITLNISNVVPNQNKNNHALVVRVYNSNYENIKSKRYNAVAGQSQVSLSIQNSEKVHIEAFQFNTNGDSIIGASIYSGMIKPSISLALAEGHGAISGALINPPDNAERLVIRRGERILGISELEKRDGPSRFIVSHLPFGQFQCSVLLYDKSSLLLQKKTYIDHSKGLGVATEVIMGNAGTEESILRLGYPNHLVDKKPNELTYLRRVQMPTSYSYKSEPSNMEIPEFINARFQVISPAYEVKAIDRNNVVLDHVDFNRHYARLVFQIDRETLKAFKFYPEFAGFSWNPSNNKWEPVLSTSFNEKSGEISVFTSHLSTFVLTALPASSSNVHDFPHCISSDFPSGIEGSGGTQFTIIEPYFKYYQDRNYYIVPLAQSTENTRTFNELGFHRAMGIATCNGGGACGPANTHKTYTGDDYIVFKAHRDLDVYLMYDTRGGVSYDDKSGDAPWITAGGFVPTDYYLETTDAVGLYGIYKKTYLKDDTIRLHGNRKGGADLTINTNYWVILKEAGNLSPSDASSLCISDPPTGPTPEIESAIAIGGDQQVTLTWQNPSYPEFQGVVIRKGITNPPLTIAEGIEPQGTVVDSRTYTDTDVVNGTTYFYSIFALDENYNYGNAFVVEGYPANDSDNDGLSDAYEDSALYGNNLKTDRLNPDTDGDGWNDYQEVIGGFDPTVPFIAPHPDSVFAGDDITICEDNIALNARPYSVGVGKWEVVQGNSTISFPNSNNCLVHNLDVGVNTLRWTVTNGPFSQSDDITITKVVSISPQFSSGDTSICGTELTISANNSGYPSYWLFKDTSTIVDTTANMAILTSISSGTHYLLWNIKHPACPLVVDSIRITVSDPGVAAYAGEDIYTDQNSILLNAALPPETIGLWATISGTATVDSISDPNSALNSFFVGSHSFEWTLFNGICGISRDTVDIVYDNIPPIINEFKLSPNHSNGSIATTLEIDATDNVGIGTWIVKELHRQSNTITFYTTPTKPEYYTIQHAEEGNYRLFLSAIDKAGNRHDYGSFVSLTVDNSIPTKLTEIHESSNYIQELKISGKYVAWTENEPQGNLNLFDGISKVNVLAGMGIRVIKIYNLKGNEILFTAMDTSTSSSTTENQNLYYYNGSNIVGLKQDSSRILSNVNCSGTQAVWSEFLDTLNIKCYYFDGNTVSEQDCRITENIHGRKFLRSGVPKVLAPWHLDLIDTIYQLSKTLDSTGYNGIIWRASNLNVTRTRYYGIIGNSGPSGLIKRSVWRLEPAPRGDHNVIVSIKGAKLGITEFPQSEIESGRILVSNTAATWIRVPTIVKSLLRGETVREGDKKTLDYKKLGSDSYIVIDTIGRNKCWHSISGNNIAYSKGKNLDHSIYFFNGKDSYRITNDIGPRFNVKLDISGNNVVWAKTEVIDLPGGGTIAKYKIILATPP